MQQNFNNINNININNLTKILYIISFMFQWSILSFILNLVTLWRFSLILFTIFILDALSMIIIKNKTIKGPSFITSKIWSLIDILTNNKYNTNPYNTVNRVKNTYYSIKTKISGFFDNIINFKNEHFKYQTERKRNRFSKEVGKKIVVEQISPGKKLQKKSFKYKDRAMSYVNVLKENGYKDFTKYNINVNTGSAYLIVNKNRDIVDIENNSIQMSHDSKDYDMIVDNWPKK